MATDTKISSRFTRIAKAAGKVALPVARIALVTSGGIIAGAGMFAAAKSASLGFPLEAYLFSAVTIPIGGGMAYGALEPKKAWELMEASPKALRSAFDSARANVKKAVNYALSFKPS